MEKTTSQQRASEAALPSQTCVKGDREQVTLRSHRDSTALPAVPPLPLPRCGRGALVRNRLVVLPLAQPVTKPLLQELRRTLGYFSPQRPCGARGGCSTLQWFPQQPPCSLAGSFPHSWKAKQALKQGLQPQRPLWEGRAPQQGAGHCRVTQPWSPRPRFWCCHRAFSRVPAEGGLPGKGSGSSGTPRKRDDIKRRDFPVYSGSVLPGRM